MNRASLRTSLSLALAALCAAPLACGPKPEPVTGPPPVLTTTPTTPTTTAPPPGPVVGPVPTGTATTAPTATAATFPGIPGVTVDPNLLAQILQAPMLTPGGSTPAGDGLATGAAEVGLRGAALVHAPNMTPEGAVMKHTLAEGGRVEAMVSMVAGRCYTIVGFSPPGGIRDANLMLLAPPLYNVSAGQDPSHDGTPVLGGGSAPYCPIVPFPVSYKLDIHAKSGGGPIAVQVFSRAK